MIKAFAVHPPEGFALLEGGGPAGAASPAFSASFDLLTTAAPALKQRAAEWAVELAEVGDLAGNLALFAKTQLK